MELIIRNVTKKIKGNMILDNVSIKMESGKIYGFVGRNGSGKTMLFRAVSGLMHIDSGEIILDGKKLYKDMDVLPKIGIILENSGLFPEYTGYKNLYMLSQINKTANAEDIRTAIIRVGLNPDDKRTYRKYSLGMKQRIAIAQAIMEHPDILLLDEPTNALDESGIELLRKIIEEEKERGALILLASHSREDIELLSDEIYTMNNGVLKKEEGVHA